MAAGRLLLFVKLPRPGQVKTRLAPPWGPDMAARLYSCFVEDILERLAGRTWPVTICFAPANAEAAMRAWLGSGYRYQAQEGADLGERMANALKRAFAEGVDRAAVVGSDLPDLPVGFVEEAQSALDEEAAVIGPATDGGYYLLGLRAEALYPEIFTGRSWSGPTVFAETLDVLIRRIGAPPVLPAWPDVDTPEDLRSLFRRNMATDFRHSRTWRLLEELGLDRMS